jgi:molybdopterin converting factor small subunit
MQHISSIFFSGVIETSDVLIAGVRSIPRRVSFFVGNGLSDLLGRNNFARWVNKTRFMSPTDTLVSRHEVAIMYFGRTSESLMMKSERMVIPTGRYTLGQLLCSLYKRGDRWVDELDDSNLLCTVNGREVRLFDTIAPGAEICISNAIQEQALDSVQAID